MEANNQMNLHVDTVNILLKLYPGHFVSEYYICMRTTTRMILFYREVTEEYDTMYSEQFMKRIDEAGSNLLKLVVGR